MLKYALPGITVHLRHNLFFHRLHKMAPELFYDDIELHSLYGCFPACIANGGRVMQGKRYTYDQMVRTFDAIAKEGMVTRLTFTNMSLKPEHYEDEYFNTILKAAEGYNVEIIIYLDELDDYLKSRYNFKRVLSTTRKLDGVEDLNKMLDRYDMVVLDYNHNKDDEFLKKVSDPTRLEVMPNEFCEPHCPYRQMHYLDNSNCQLAGIETQFRCHSKPEKFGYTTRTDTSLTMLGNDDIRRLNQTYGITYFKIVGRGVSYALNKETYGYYLVRPEYRDYVFELLESKFTFIKP